MELSIEKSEFLKGLKMAQSIADRKSTMPMLANVLLRPSDDGVLVAATDYNISATAVLQGKTKGESGLTIVAKTLYDVVNNMPSGELRLIQEPNNWVKVQSGSVEYKLVGMPDREFPAVPETDDVEFVKVDAQLLRQMIDRVSFSISPDPTRYDLAGAYFESDGTVAKMVSTDGHRLSKVERPLDGPTLTAGVIIPRKGILEMRRILEGVTECEIAVKTPHFFVRTPGAVLAAKLVSAKFPNYQKVIPTSDPSVATVDKGLLLDALKRCQLMSADSRAVKFEVTEGNLKVTSFNPDVGEVREDLAIDYGGEETTIGFNPKYVIDILNQIDSDQVCIELRGKLTGGLVRPTGGDNFLGVIMPIMIN